MESTTKIWLKLALPGRLHHFFRPQVSQSVIEAEALWASFVDEHNLALAGNSENPALIWKKFVDQFVEKRWATWLDL